VKGRAKRRFCPVHREIRSRCDALGAARTTLRHRIRVQRHPGLLLRNTKLHRGREVIRLRGLAQTVQHRLLTTPTSASAAIS
jgi:hypothetical protein